jgi:hypothetical protein
MGFGLDIGFTANLHKSQITTAEAKSSPACCVFTKRFLATALTVEILQLHALTPFPAGHRLTTPVQNCLPTDFVSCL